MRAPLTNAHLLQAFKISEIGIGADSDKAAAKRHDPGENQQSVCDELLIIEQIFRVLFRSSNLGLRQKAVGDQVAWHQNNGGQQ